MVWIPEAEQKLMDELQREYDLILLGLIPISEPEPLDQKFIFVECFDPYYTCMERQSDKQIFEMLKMGEPDLSKPVDRKFFNRYSRGMDL